MRFGSDLTQVDVSGSAKRMGRIKKWAEDMQARFQAGTFARIAAVLHGDEDRTDFVRGAVERELKRRERAKPKDADGDQDRAGTSRD